MSDDFNRRMEDPRLIRLESRLDEVYAKVTNGLSERSKETRDKVNELDRKHDELMNVFIEHATKEQQITLMHSEAINELTEITKKWEGRIVKSLWGLLGVAVVIGGYVLTHLEALAEILKPLAG